MPKSALRTYQGAQTLLEWVLALDHMLCSPTSYMLIKSKTVVVATHWVRTAGWQLGWVDVSPDLDFTLYDVYDTEWTEPRT